MAVHNIVQKIENISELVRFFSFEFNVIDNYELTKNEIKTLMQLKFKSGQPLSFYSHKVGLKKGSFTALTDKLEEKGLIKKSYIEHDKRKKIIVPSELGIIVTNKFYDNLVEQLSKKFSLLSETDLVLLDSAINILSKIDLNS